MRSTAHRGRSMVLGTLVALALPGAAHAATTKPTATTKPASNVAQTSAVLNGSVDPNGRETSYLFQIGTTPLYGTDTQLTPVGHGKSAKSVSVAAGGLAPATRYHYRIVAIAGSTIARGKDRTFKTASQPLALQLTAATNPARFGRSVSFSGTLSGTGNAGRQVVLQASQWPYTTGFTNVGNTFLTAADGSFSFTLPGPPVNTQYRVQMPTKPEVVSPVVALGVTVHVATGAKPRKVRKGHRVRFHGKITPAVDGQQVVVQRLVHGAWKQVAQTVARHVNGKVSSYRRRVKIRHSGSYRVVVNVAAGVYASSNGRTIAIKLRRHR